MQIDEEKELFLGLIILEELQRKMVFDCQVEEHQQLFL